MKIEITNSFLKDVTKALKKESPFLNGYVEIDKVSVDLFDEPMYTLRISWGCEKFGKEEIPMHYSTELEFFENASIDYIRGMFATVVIQEMKKSEI